MHYPIDEKTRKHYGMSKGEKVEEPPTLEETEKERAKDSEHLATAIDKKSKEINVKQEDKKKK